MDKAISMKFSVNELVFMYTSSNVLFISKWTLFFKRNRNFCNEKPKNYLKNGKYTLNVISKLKILVKNDRKLIFELRCNNKLIMCNNF